MLYEDTAFLIYLIKLMDSKKISIGVGLTIVFGTHIAMLVDAIPMNTMMDK